jgi:hypothetical protein
MRASLLASVLGLALRPAPLAAAESVALVLADVTAEAGLASARGDRFSFADVDGDGDPDLLIDGTRLYRNDSDAGGIRFTDVTAGSGIGDGPGPSGCFADFDGDGDLDVVTTGGALKVQFEPWRFRNEAAAWGLDPPDHQAVLGVGDVDGDGRPDVLFGGGEDWNEGNPRYFARRLYRNVDGKAFEDVTDAHDLAGGRYGRAVAWADFDADGDLDVYLGNYRLQANELLVHDDDRLADRAAALGVAGRVTDDRGTLPTGQRVGLRRGHTIAASWADLDGDGDLDLWVSNLVHKFVGPAEGFPGGFDYRGWICDDSAIYRNDGAGAFVDVRESSGIALRPVGGRGTFEGDELWSHAACGDLDGDGLPEVFVTQVYALPYSHALLFLNLGGLRFREVSAEVGLRRFDSYGGAFADVDGDGDLDLVADGRPAHDDERRSVVLLRNDTAPGPWIAFRLAGRRGDPLPVGAQVIVETADGARLVRQLEAGMGSHAQQSEGVLRFGLRGRTFVRARVRWPFGPEQGVADARPGRVNRVVRQ